MKSLLFLFILVIQISCQSTKALKDKPLNNSQELFWQSLKKLCGQAFKGVVIAAPHNDTSFRDKTLVMHVRSCEENRIRIPFIVGDNRSRTWVFSRYSNDILLEHDHRHKDGTADSITFYGG